MSLNGMTFTFAETAAACNSAGLHFIQSAAGIWIETGTQGDSVAQRQANAILEDSERYLELGIVDEDWTWRSHAMQKEARDACLAIDTDGDGAVTWQQLWDYAASVGKRDESAFMLAVRKMEYQNQVNLFGGAVDPVDGPKPASLLMEVEDHYDRLQSGQFGDPDMIRKVYSTIDADDDGLITFADVEAALAACNTCGECETCGDCDTCGECATCGDCDTCGECATCGDCDTGECGTGECVDCDVNFWDTHESAKAFLENCTGWRHWLNLDVPAGSCFMQDLWQNLTVEDWVDLNTALTECNDCGKDPCKDGDCCPIKAIEEAVADLQQNLDGIVDEVNQIKAGGTYQYNATA